jgi:S-DNA-T family DNA segregation ATPase FtsK/SpoIIIE
LAKRKTKKSERRARSAPRQPGRLEAEATALGLFAVALFVEVALWSYHPADPLWGFGTRVHNLCGPVGALVAGGLAGALGLAAHVLPIAGIVIGVRYLRGQPVRPRWIPTVAWTLLWVTLAAGFEAAGRALPDLLPHTPGGVVGRGLVAGLESGFYLAGSSVLIAVTALLSLLVATGISIRDAGSFVARITRTAARSTVQHAMVNAVRLRRRVRKIVIASPSALRTAAEAPVTARRVLPRRERAGEPEVVEHRSAPVQAPRQQALPFGGAGAAGPFELPDLDLLAKGVEDDRQLDRDSLIQNSQVLEKKLADFSVSGRVVKVHPGPVITMYEFEPAPGIKVSRIVNLADDLALALRALSVRIVAPIPGKSVVGIEVPNLDREVVVLRDLLAHPSYQDQDSKLTIALGKDIFGAPITADLAKMPHLLVAGATGAGKSVFLNSILCSLFFKATPDEVKLLLIDPKMLEFSLFHNIPHLISDVVTNPKRAAAALMGVVRKMEERYELMAARGVRSIDQYNRQVAKDAAHAPKGEEVARPLAYIVVVIDELADLMIVASRDVEESLMRLAQMARAAGIHLVLATQRPSVDVLTGIIKANFPSRIAFQVSSRTDSRTVLDANGAERLLGQGDLLYLPPGSARLERIHGPYVSEREVQTVAEFLRTQGGPELDPTIIRLKEESEKREERGDDFDELFDEAVDIIARHRIASISFVQRKLKIGYNRAARIVEQMEEEGIVGPQEGTKAREIFVRPPEE